jgi:signal transduction histidine kinase
VLSIYGGRLKNSDIVVEKRLRAKRPVVCLEGDIRQVLNNLVDNALDAMPGGGHLFIRSREGTDWQSDAQGLILTGADTGGGIAPETLAKVFDPFFTTKGIGGTGLGLWISAEIIARHRGRIRIRSRQGRKSGTVVSLFLPFEMA